MLIPATPSLGNTVICRYPGFTFQTFVKQFESIILSPFLKGFPFQLSENSSHTPSFINIISGHKPCRTILNLFQFFLKLIRMGVPDRASILEDWTHHTFVSCFLHILGAEEKSSPHETKCSIRFSANIADMRMNTHLTSPLSHRCRGPSKPSMTSVDPFLYGFLHPVGCPGM